MHAKRECGVRRGVFDGGESGNQHFGPVPDRQRGDFRLSYEALDVERASTRSKRLANPPDLRAPTLPVGQLEQEIEHLFVPLRRKIAARHIER